jgi:dTDP-4-dehydro-6-deoxy-alpha-D-glucopyranose 2,3-dehydratase
MNKFQTILELFEKLEEIKTTNHFAVKEIPFNDFKQWSFKGHGYDYLAHDSGKFFRIEGIRVKTNFGALHTWDQPIIKQREIGILGILSKEMEGQRYYLMQAKMEPGNVNILQLSPTCQATKSNLTQVHKGNAPAYLEYFLEPKKVLIDQLQSEQGGRFLQKRNRNMVIDVEEDVEVLDGFFWLTLSDIKELLKYDNFVNMDSRSVIATISSNYHKRYFQEEEYDMRLSDAWQKHTTKKILSWYIDQKFKYELETEQIQLDFMENWNISPNSISQDDRYFSVIAVEVKAGNREVVSWTQPMIKDTNQGLIGLIKKNIGGTDHYLMQAKVMPGNMDIVDLSPTITISNWKYFDDKIQPRFYNYFIRTEENVIYDVLQSEEGGRFYHMQTRNMIVETDKDFEVPDNYKWMTYNQIMVFMELGMCNIETRSLISTL